jgi:hypothetical protein
MIASGLLKCVAAAAAVAILSACAGPSVAPSTSTVARTYSYIGRTLAVNARPVTAARPPSALPRYATMPPNPQATSKRFEYIINDYGTYAGIFDYPRSTKQIGTIYNVGGQGCTNVLYGYGKKTFWIVAADNQIEEFKVPQKLLRTLSDTIGAPSSCAMDTRGDLAVGILYGSGQGDIVIYKNASGSGAVYSTPLGEEFFDGYDNNGNLFADGFTDSGFFGLVELPKGSGTFQTITTSNSVQFPGSVQWDGKYLTVFDQAVNVTYRYVVSGTRAMLKGTVQLSGAGDCAQTWIVPGLIYCADAGNSNGEVYKYPAGGSAIGVFTGNFDLPLGVAAAKK